MASGYEDLTTGSASEVELSGNASTRSTTNEEKAGTKDGSAPSKEELRDSLHRISVCMSDLNKAVSVLRAQID